MIRIISIIFFCFAFSLQAEVLSTKEAATEIKRLRRENKILRKQLGMQDSKIQKLEEQVSRLSQQTADSNDQTITAEQKKESEWKHQVSLGGTLTRGNRKAFLLNTKASSTLKTQIDKLSLEAMYNFARENEETTAKSFSGSVKYNHDIADDWYWLILGSAEHDEIAGVDYKTTLSPGIGHYFLRNEEMELSAEAGPAYLFRRLEGSDPEHTGQGRFAQDFTWNISEHVKFFENLEFLTNVEMFADYLLEAEVGIETSITQQLNLRLSCKDQYKNRPSQDRQKNDFSFITSIVWDF